jgi:hypothetical protein
MSHKMRVLEEGNMEKKAWRGCSHKDKASTDAVASSIPVEEGGQRLLAGSIFVVIASVMVTGRQLMQSQHQPLQTQYI